MIQKTSPVRRWKQWLALPLAAALFVVVASGRTAAQGGPISTARPTAVLREGTPPPPPPVAVGEKYPVVAPPVYTYVENMPHLPGGGGNNAIVNAIQQQIVYPAVAPAAQHTGRVFVSFTVSDEGVVNAVRVIKGLALEYDAAVVAAVQKLPRFVPGTQAGKAVSVSFTVPISFASATPPNSERSK